MKTDYITVGNWHLDGDANDSSGGGFNLTVAGATSTDSGYFQGGYVFDRVSNDRLELATAGYRSSDSGGTIEAILKVASTPGEGTFMEFFSSADQSTNVNTFSPHLREVSGKHRIGFYTNTGTAQVLYGDTDISLNEFVYVAVTSNGTSISMYVNGHQESITVALGSNNGDWFADVSGRDNIVIGSRLRLAGATSSFDGTIDSVRVSSVERSEKEIREIYNKTKGVYSLN